MPPKGLKYIGSSISDPDAEDYSFGRSFEIEPADPPEDSDEDSEEESNESSEEEDEESDEGESNESKN